MKKILLLGYLFSLSISLLAQEKKIYFFSLSQPKTCISHELLITPFIHHARSPKIANYYYASGEYLIPTPVYNRIYSIASLTYQPKFRLVEFGSKLAITLRTPITAGLSFSDLRTPEGERWSPATLDPFNTITKRYENSRYSGLGGFHVEGGALIGIDYGFGSTVENTNKSGISIGAGINQIYAPLLLATNYDNQTREDYAGLLTWHTLVSQVGLHFRRVSFYYMFSARPSKIYYKSQNLVTEKSVLTNTYQRFSIGINL